MQDKTFPQFDMFKVLETYKRSVDAYNSYGLKKTSDLSKDPSNVKKVLGEKN